MSGRRSSLTELERLLRIVQPGARNLGRYLAEHGESLAPRLGVEVEELRAIAALSDQAAALRVKALLDRRADAMAQIHEATVQEVVTEAVQRLAATAVWSGPAASIDVGLLLGALLADPIREYICLKSSTFEVPLLRSKLVAAAKVLLHHYDLAGWVDSEGLHLRWRGGRGGLNLHPQTVRPGEARHVLVVNIPPPPPREEHRPVASARPRRAPPRVPAPAAPSAARGPVKWFAELLEQIALGP